MFKISHVHSVSGLKEAEIIMKRIYDEAPHHWPYKLSAAHFDGGLYLVREKLSNTPIGFVGWQERNEVQPVKHAGKTHDPVLNRLAESFGVRLVKVGYYSIGILPEYRRNKFAKAALTKLIAMKSAGVDQVRALIVSSNSPSMALADSLGVEKQVKRAAQQRDSGTASLMGQAAFGGLSLDTALQGAKLWNAGNDMSGFHEDVLKNLPAVRDPRRAVGLAEQYGDMAQKALRTRIMGVPISTWSGSRLPPVGITQLIKAHGPVEGTKAIVNYALGREHMLTPESLDIMRESAGHYQHMATDPNRLIAHEMVTDSAKMPAARGTGGVMRSIASRLGPSVMNDTNVRNPVSNWMRGMFNASKPLSRVSPKALEWGASAYAQWMRGAGKALLPLGLLGAYMGLRRPVQALMGEKQAGKLGLLERALGAFSPHIPEGILGPRARDLARAGGVHLVSAPDNLSSPLNFSKLNILGKSVSTNPFSAIHNFLGNFKQYPTLHSMERPPSNLEGLTYSPGGYALPKPDDPATSKAISASLSGWNGDKLQESRAFKGFIPKTQPASKFTGSLDSQREQIADQMGDKFIMKTRYGTQSTPSRLVTEQSTPNAMRSALQRPNMLVQQRVPMEQIPDWQKSLDNTITSRYPEVQRFNHGNREMRVHVMNGKVLPYGSMERGSVTGNLNMLLPWRTSRMRDAEALVQQAVDKLPPNLRNKSVYGFDVGFDRASNPFIIESNPTDMMGQSGLLEHPLVMDATSAAIQGKLPLYVKARRLGAGLGLLGMGHMGLNAMTPNNNQPKW